MNDFHTAKIVRLLGNFVIVNNLSRKKCCISIILAMIQTRRVQFYELGLVLNDHVKPESNEDRIHRGAGQRFFAEAQLNEEELAFLLSLFLTLGKVDLCLDRTEWDFGKTQVNLLVMSAYCQGIGLPLYIDFLDNNSGNSNASQRISILKKTIELLGKFRISSLCADREFIGTAWFDYLLKERIPFFIRIPKSYRLTVGGVSLKAETLLGERKQCKVDGISVVGRDGLSVGIAKIAHKNRPSDLLIVLTNTYAYLAVRHYQKRWSIEVMFQDFKRQGFNIEDTHIPMPERIVKMVYLVAIAYAWCIHIGIIIEQKAEKILLKKHGYRAKSIFRKGMDRLRADLCKKMVPDLTLWHELTERFIRMARIKLLIYNALRKS